MAAATIPKASELFREKVVARYYSVTSALQRLDTAIDITDSASTTESGFVPRSSLDTALTAFAQLGVLRLDASRAFITLIDSRNQYVLAESTRSLSLQCDTRHDKTDRLVLGAVAMPRHQNVMSNLILGQFRHSERSKSEESTSSVIVIKDLLEISEFATSSWVVWGPKIRFAVGVPLSTSDGTVVGIFSVYDNKPRPGGITPEQSAFVEDVGTTIMSHLDAMRTQAEYKRRDKLINGLESFLEGLGDLRVSLHGKPSKVRKAGNVAQGDANADEKAAELESVTSPVPTSQHSAETNEDSSSLWESALPKGSKSMFSRASRILNQAGEWDGVAFFYVASSPRSQHKTRRGLFPPKDDQLRSPHQISTSSGQDSGDSPPEGQRSRAGSVTDSSLTEDTDMNTSCPLLAHSLSESEKGSRSSDAPVFANFTRRDLHQIFGRSPKGKTFVLDDQARVIAGDTSNTDPGTESAVSAGDSVSKSGEDGKPNNPARRKQTRRVASLRKLSHTARSFTILPLWDLERQRWFSYCVCWADAPRDPTLDGGLNYLKVFSSTVMSALSYIDALASDRAKTSFVSSMSHELRSPLHGILGANNFLSDSQLTQFQEEMVQSITSCGRTLLDTLEHVLDFTKINSFAPNQRSRVDGEKLRGRNAPSGGRENKSVPEDGTSISRAVNLALLVEEVSEAIVMGFSVQHQFLFSDEKTVDDWMKNSHVPQAEGDSGLEQETLPRRIRVRIALALEPHQNAWFVTTPGAWRRIVANLLSNAIKFTTDGLITIGLEVTEDTEKEGRTNVTLTIKDSGCGISTDYLHSHLFKPFSQEDSFASGTGLGLSIVSQVVRALHGTVDVTSTKGIGTTVKVDVPMRQSSPPSSLASQIDMFSAARGLKICMMEDTASRASVAQDAVQRTSESSYSQSLMKLLREWFKSDVSIEDSWSPGSADVVICLEPSFRILENIRSQASTHSCRAPPVIFVASDALELAALRGDARILSSASVVELVCQPVGPRKLAKSLAQCISRMEKREDPSAQSRPVLNRHRSRVSNGGSQSPSPAPSWDGRGHKVLICDDNPVNLRLLGAFLRRQKVYYQEATNGQEALDKYISANGSYNFIFMDISMPVMDGITSSRLIRDFEKKNSLTRRAIIALTGLASAAARSEAAEAGIDEFITKPINFKLLQDLLKTDT